MVKLLGVLGSFLCLGLFADLLYTDSSFNRLNSSELDRLLLENPKQKLQISFFKAEALFLTGKPHQARQLVKSLETVCSGLTTEKSRLREELACLLLDLGFEEKKSGLAYFLNPTRLEKRLKLLSSPLFSFEERAYLEGRILWRIPDSFGGNPGKSLLALEALKRLRPDLSCTDFFKGQIFESEGKTKLALQAFENALKASPPDPRADWRTRFNSRVGGGIFGVVANPAGGVGALVGYEDRYFGDQNRHWHLSFSAQSRGVYRGKFLIEDAEIFPPWISRFELQGAREIDQFFGWGAKSQLGDLTEIVQTTGTLKLGLKKNIAPFYFRASLGGFVRNAIQVRGPFQALKELKEKQQSFIPEFEFGFFQEGTEFSTTLFGSQESLFSTHTFSGVHAKGRLGWDLGSGNILSFLFQYRFVSMDTPFAFLTALSGNLYLPGVRPGRFRQNEGGASSLQWEHPLGSYWRIRAFGNLGFFGNPWLTGGGIALGWGVAPFGGQIELGHFAGENLILAGIRLVDG